MTGIKTIAAEKTYLEARLQALKVINTYGKTIDELTELNIDEIETNKKLFEINRQIKKYIEG